VKKTNFYINLIKLRIILAYFFFFCYISACIYINGQVKSWLNSLRGQEFERFNEPLLDGYYSTIKTKICTGTTIPSLQHSLSLSLSFIFRWTSQTSKMCYINSNVKKNCSERSIIYPYIGHFLGIFPREYYKSQHKWVIKL